MVHYGDEMRVKRRGLVALVLAVVLLMVWVVKGNPGPWGLGLGWLGIFCGVIAGNRLTLCPACRGRLGSLFDKLCAHCGALLTDEPILPPSEKRPVDPRAAAYMAESRRILQRWGAVRKRLGGKTIALVGLAAALAVFAWVWSYGPEHRSDAVVVSLVCWPVISGLYWLVVVFGADNLFSIYFMLARGRCPLCRGWFNPPSTVGPESIHIDLSLPKFCPHCSAKLS